MKFSYALLLVLFFLSSCAYDNSDISVPFQLKNDSTISYKKDIVPVVQTYCYGENGNHCHVTSSDYYGIGDFTTYNGLKEQISNGMIEQKLFGQYVLMPPLDSPQLPDSDLQKFHVWVTQGALNN